MSKSRENNFQMGQIIYLLSEKAEKIVPAIVTEEVLVKKLDGNSVSWKVAVGPPNKRKEVDSNKLNGEVYSSLEDIREAMTQRLNDFIDALIGDAKKRTETWYGKHIIEQVNSDGGGGKIDPAVLIDSIEEQTQNDMFIQGGTNADPQYPKSVKVKAPGPTGPLGSEDSLGEPEEALKRKYGSHLVDLATPTDEEMGSAEESGDFVMGADGNPVPVKYNIKE
jgi:hypothetical protein